MEVFYQADKAKNGLIFMDNCGHSSCGFPIKGQENSLEGVPYDLAAITVHSGTSVHAGHYYTYLRKQVEGQWKFFRYDDKRKPKECLNEQALFQDVAQNGYIFYYRKRENGDIAPPEFVISEVVVPEIMVPEVMVPEFPILPEIVMEDKLSEARKWVATNLLGKFRIIKALSIPQIKTVELMFSVFKKFAEHAKRAVYLIDRNNDEDLVILEEGYPIPSDNFRFGENFVSNGVIYMMRQQDNSYVVLEKEPEATPLEYKN